MAKYLDSKKIFTKSHVKITSVIEFFFFERDWALKIQWLATHIRSIYLQKEHCIPL